ncbi:MAG: A/G-specific adenine glycosylase [Actinomycetota bacterium]|nr:A/G-specific adenine glycosylase [Actinomycetota bacterium]
MPGALPIGALLEFFAAKGRELPWRDPAAGAWAVLTSEIMLQQTPVARVLAGYLDWMRRWPTPAALAAAAPGDAVRVWGRLGYPRRALRLHAAANAIKDHHDGMVPSEIDQLLALPGVGEYTARAVAAFAFGARVPVVDTNVRRVLNRLVRGTDDAGSATAADRRLMESLLPADPSTAALLSGAVMEFGALVCTAARPRCDDCPVVSACRWTAAGRPASTVQRRRQAWAGTDRQVRGRIMAAVRQATGAVDLVALSRVWPDTGQWRRCLDSLLADGLLETAGDGQLALPGHGEPSRRRG